MSKERKSKWTQQQLTEKKRHRVYWRQGRRANNSHMNRGVATTLYHEDAETFREGQLYPRDLEKYDWRGCWPRLYQLALLSTSRVPNSSHTREERTDTAGNRGRGNRQCDSLGTIPAQMEKKWREVQKEVGVCWLQPKEWGAPQNDNWFVWFTRTTVSHAPAPFYCLFYILYLQEIIFITEQATAKTIISLR